MKTLAIKPPLSLGLGKIVPPYRNSTIQLSIFSKQLDVFLVKICSANKV